MNTPTSRTGTLSPGVVTTVTITGYGERIEVINVDGTASITYRIDETVTASDITDPSVNGSDAWILPAAITSREHDVDLGLGSPGVTVKMISSGSPRYWVVAS